VILVRRLGDGSYEVVDGHTRLQVLLELHGHAEVIDMQTRATLRVHEVGDRRLVLTGDAQNDLEGMADAMIERVRDPKPTAPADFPWPTSRPAPRAYANDISRLIPE